MMKSEATVIIVDDDEGVCRALLRLIQSVGWGAQSFASAEEFLNHFDPTQPGCLVLDVRMSGLSGLDLQGELVARGISIPIIFITGHGDVPMSVRAMRAGAVDFLQKPFREQSLLDAIRNAIARDGELRLARADREMILSRVKRLTPREREVFQLVAAGKLNKQIAQDLGASEKTIKVHRGRVMQKMEAESLADLVLHASVAGFVGPNGTTAVPNTK